MSDISVRRSRWRNLRSILVSVAVTLFIPIGFAFLDARPAGASEIGIVFTGEPPASAVAGSSMSVVVSIQNDYQTVTSGPGSTDDITIGSSCALSQSSSLTETAVKGVATFPSVTIDTGPSCTVIATDTTAPDEGLIAVSSSTALSPGPPSHLAFTVWPSPGEVTAGTAAAPFVVTVEDAYGNVETNGAGSSDVINITSPCALSGTVTLTADSGTATFRNVVPSVSGACPLTASDGTRSILAASSAITSPPIAPAPLRVIRVSRAAKIGKVTTLYIVGRGFYGRPRVLTDARSIKALVTRDTGNLLTVVVTAKSTTSRGIHVFTITLPNGKRTSVRVNVT
jgi:hypothetical protein